MPPPSSWFGDFLRTNPSDYPESGRLCADGFSRNNKTKNNRKILRPAMKPHEPGLSNGAYITISKM